MSKGAFATLSRRGPAAAGVSEREPVMPRPRDDEVFLDLAERARELARRFRHDPLLGDREARLTAIRRRWYGWDERAEKRLDC